MLSPAHWRVWVKRLANVVIGILAIVYVCDDLSVRYRIPRRRQTFGAVTIQRYDAIPEKNNKTEFVYEEPINQSCVHSIFPHFGYQPCWYLARHSERRINY